MGLFNLQLDYGMRIFFSRENIESRYVVPLNEHAKVYMTPIGFSVEIERDVPQDVREDLVKGVHSLNPDTNPQWYHITSISHHFLRDLKKTFWESAIFFDGHLRKSTHAARLPSVRLPLLHSNSSNRWTVAHWRYSEEELASIQEIDEFKNSRRNYRDKGLTIPLPKVEARQCILSKADCENIIQSVSKGQEANIAYRHLSIAWSNFEQGMYGISIVMAAITIETGIKAYLSSQSSLVERMLDRMPSPQLRDLVEIACELCDLNFPIELRKRLPRIAEIRNHVVHKSQSSTINVFEAARALAISEALLKSIDGVTCDPHIGSLIKVNPSTHFNNERLPSNTTGIILRKERFNGEDWFHILVDSGMTWRFSPNSFIVPKQQKLAEY
ncbi:MAG: hypothetical protein AAFR26_05535 [Cyanobacteria bacterium J06626_4]